MPTKLAAPSADMHAAYNKPRMFFLSALALLTAGISFSMRTIIADDLKTTFFEPINRLHSAEMLGSVLGVALQLAVRCSTSSGWAGCWLGRAPVSSSGR